MKTVYYFLSFWSKNRTVDDLPSYMLLYRYLTRRGLHILVLVNSCTPYSAPRFCLSSSKVSFTCCPLSILWEFHKYNTDIPFWRTLHLSRPVHLPRRALCSLA